MREHRAVKKNRQSAVLMQMTNILFSSAAARYFRMCFGSLQRVELTAASDKKLRLRWLAALLKRHSRHWSWRFGIELSYFLVPLDGSYSLVAMLLICYSLRRKTFSRFHELSSKQKVYGGFKRKKIDPDPELEDILISQRGETPSISIRNVPSRKALDVSLVNRVSLYRESFQGLHFCHFSSEASLIPKR